MFALLLAPLLVFHGNVALVEDVYRAALDLPASTAATTANARSVAARLRRFLHQAGYTLATVQAQVAGDQIAVQIDEGRLDKVIFLGGGAFETLRLRLDLHLHENVFNKPELERQLKVLAQRLGLAEFAYDVVPVPNAPLPPLQLQEIEPLEELSLGLLRPGRPYELHILVQPGQFRPGISPELEVDSLEGGGLGAVYHSGRLLLGEDRLRLAGRLAGALRQKLDNTGTRFVFTRALGEASWEAPPLAGFIRPSFAARADLSDRQRSDLGLESFQFATLEAAAQVLFVPVPEVRASIGAGFQRRLLYALEPTDGTVIGPSNGERAHTRDFAEAALQIMFDPASIRIDRHHVIALQVRAYGSPHPGDDRALHLLGRWQKMFLLGWNELWLEARGVSRTGYVLFPEEESIGGDALRGPFSNDYARRLGALDVEFRFSLLRDVLKIGVFHNAVAYGAIDRATNAEKATVADSFGVGVHALLIDEFQLDAYFGVGFASGGRFDRGAALTIRQAF